MAVSKIKGVEVKRDILWRVYLSFIGISVLGMVVLGRAFYIQQFQGSYWKSMSDSMHQKFVPLDAERGTIYSEDGQMLSTSVPYFDIYMDLGADGLREKNGKRFRENIDSFSVALSKFFRNKSASQYKKDLKKAYNEKNRYYLIRKGLSFEEYKEFRSLPLVKLGRNKSGVIAEVRSRRLNPFGLLAKRTIGLARDNAQNVGLERTYDSLLKGTSGKRLVRFIAGGAAVPVEGYEIEPEMGKDIITTIDIQMQDIVTSALLKMLQEQDAPHGTCIVMETKTGKIKAIANLGRDKNGNYNEQLNYALQTTEPGSTIKLATLLAVLEHGTVNLNTMIEVGTSGNQFVGVRNVTDAERSPKSMMTLKECFAHSSNVGISKVAFQAFATQPDLFKNYLQKFHLDKKTGIDLVGEERPVLPRLKRNKEGLHAMVTASFGYAIEVSPLHTLMLYNAVANNGKMVKPYLVNSIRSNGITIKEFEPEVVDDQICKASTIQAARASMEAVISEGTAKEVFKDFPFSVAGKTGTAHVAGGAVKYHDGIYQASFAGYFPADNPEYTCVVVVKTKPRAVKHYGGQLAAPVFRDIALKLFAQFIKPRNQKNLPLQADSSQFTYAGFSPDMKSIFQTLRLPATDSATNAEWLTAYNNIHNKVILKSRQQEKNRMPDVRELTLKDALYLLENMNMKVVVKGKGKVVAQDILPGMPVRKNQTINLLLN